MAKLNMIGSATAGATHIALTPVQAGITVVDTLNSTAQTIAETGKNIAKTLLYPFTGKTWKPNRKTYGTKIRGKKEGFAKRQIDHWNEYAAPFYGDSDKIAIASKATGALAHFGTAIPANTAATAVDATYSGVQTPLSVLKNIGKSILYPFTGKTWKPKFKSDLKEVWGKEKGFAYRTKNSRNEIFNVLAA